MRQSRKQILSIPEGYVHCVWKCHNSEFYLEKRESRELLLGIFFKYLTLNGANYLNKVHLHAFCVMSNHVHFLMSYEGGSENLSDFLRRCNGVFGQTYNRLNRRSGKVANARPFVSLIESYEHALRVHMYIEANPIRSGMRDLENLHLDRFNSYRLFAFGDADVQTKKMVLPGWYMELGESPEMRQEKYRRIFAEYVMGDMKEQLGVVLQRPYAGSGIEEFALKEPLRRLINSARQS